MSSMNQVAAVSEVLAGSLTFLQNLLAQSLKTPRLRPNSKIETTKERSVLPASGSDSYGLDVARLLSAAPDIHRIFAVKTPENASLPVTFADCLDVQQRGFKTRTTQGFSGSKHQGKAEKSKVLGSVSLGSIWDSVLKGTKKEGNALAEKHESMKTLLSGVELSEESKTKMKVAFSEGYMAGKKQKMEEKEAQGIGTRLFKLFVYTALLYVLVRLLFSDIRVKGSGGNFGLLLGGSPNEVTPEEVNVTFADVKGIDEAKDEVMEIVEYLRDPEKFSRLGGRLPKGILLVGQPGCGKTLLARAIAGEAGVPFFHASGSEFDEVLVGQGARRVRDLFAQAKNRSPAVIFIDEVDSVGAKRVSTAIHPYANQTINQLLNEMDGFQKNEGIIVLAATNRRDDLDRALLRPGRFDVEVTIPIPDLRGRKEIINLYLSKVVVGEDVDVETLAKGTTGFTGADIENMVNQGAIRAAADGMKDVSMSYMESARDKVLMGPEKKHKIPDQETNRNTAYHEAGHTLVAFYTKDATPLHKVTIVPRGTSLGMTQMMDDKDRYQMTKSQLLAQMDVAMGGRAAEELILGSDKITTGAMNDLEGATALATQMVKSFGMSDKVGLRKFEDPSAQNVFFPVNEQMSESTSDAIDTEIKRLLQESFDRARDILKSHSKELKRLAENLLDRETLSADQIRQVIEGKSLE